MRLEQAKRLGYLLVAVLLGVVWWVGFVNVVDAVATSDCRSVQPVEVVNHAGGITAAELAQDERAIELQSSQVARVWHIPCVQFVAASSWRVDIRSRPVICLRHELGCHGGNPEIAEVESFGGWRQTLSHEVLEMVGDRTGRQLCDRVEDFWYRIGGVPVSDFVLPGGGDWMHLRRQVGKHRVIGRG